MIVKPIIRDDLSEATLLTPIEKSKKLRTCVESVINDKNNTRIIDFLRHDLSVEMNKIIDTYIYYNMDLYAYGNEIYEGLELRFVLFFQNLLKGSWHQDGNRVVVDYIKLLSPKTLIDIGFGVPMPYVKSLMAERRTRMDLCDAFDSAFIFFRSLLNYWQSDWESYISFKKTDIDSENFHGNYDLYLFLDSIEHMPNPTAYLANYVKNAPLASHFLFVLPINPIIVPVHEISWCTAEEACGWLRACGLEVTKSKVISINPEVDLFAEQFNFSYSSLIALCRKGKARYAEKYD